MNTGYLTVRQIEILRCLQDKTNGEFKTLLERDICGPLPIYNLEAVCDLIDNEYLMEGIEENYSPNKYGRELESLRAIINKPRIM